MAKRTGIPLIIAGNIPDDYKGWFEANVAPHIDDRLIRYVGPVNDQQKNAPPLARSVIGYRRGAVPEVVTHGETGYVVDTVEEMAAAVGAVGVIDRANGAAALRGAFQRRRDCRSLSRDLQRLAAGRDGREA